MPTVAIDIRWRRWAILLALLALAVPGLARGITLRVDNDGHEGDAQPGDGRCATAGGRCTLLAAVEESNARRGADTIQLPAGSFRSDAAITDALTISGQGIGVSIIRNSGLSGAAALQVAANGTLRLAGVTVTTGLIFAASSTTSDVVIIYTDNLGRGIVNSGVLRIDDSELSSLDLALENSGVASIENTRIADAYGISNSGLLTLYRDTFEFTATAVSNSGEAELESCVIRYSGTSRCEPFAAANVAVRNTGGRLTMRSTQVLESNAGAVGLANAGGVARIEHSRLSGNRGGAILNGNSGGDVGELTLRDSVVTANGAGGPCGFGQRATVFAGGIHNNGVATIERTTISGNTYTTGAGILNDGTLIARNTTLSGNVAVAAGGGLATSGGAELTFVTIADNQTNAGDGGGVAVLPGGSLAIAASILSGNRQLIVNGSECQGAVTSRGGNVLGSRPGCEWTRESGRDLIGVDPRLGALEATDGGLPVHAVGDGSPAIDLVSAACAGTDENGVTRPRGRGCDAGASERARGCGNRQRDAGEQCDDGNRAANDCCSPTCQFEAIRGDCDADGSVSVAELVQGVTIAAGDARLERCPAIDNDDDGAASIADLIVAVDTALGGCR